MDVFGYDLVREILEKDNGNLLPTQIHGLLGKNTSYFLTFEDLLKYKYPLICIRKRIEIYSNGSDDDADLYRIIDKDYAILNNGDDFLCNSKHTLIRTIHYFSKMPFDNKDEENTDFEKFFDKYNKILNLNGIDESEVTETKDGFYQLPIIKGVFYNHFQKFIANSGWVLWLKPYVTDDFDEGLGIIFKEPDEESVNDMEFIDDFEDEHLEFAINQFPRIHGADI